VLPGSPEVLERRLRLDGGEAAEPLRDPPHLRVREHLGRRASGRRLERLKERFPGSARREAREQIEELVDPRDRRLEEGIGLAPSLVVLVPGGAAGGAAEPLGPVPAEGRDAGPAGEALEPAARQRRAAGAEVEQV